jgi:hypothetical protein
VRDIKIKQEVAMAYQVKMEAVVRDIQHKDISFRVKNDGKVVGYLRVSKGGLEWCPSGKWVRVANFKWDKFAEIMKQYVE